jgi:hypothetical protein
MNTPPLLLGATLLFWGWQSGCVEIAAVLAALLEGARWLPRRWELEQRDFDRLWNLCSVLFLGAAVYALAERQGPHVLGAWLRAAQTDLNSDLDLASGAARVTRASLAFIQWWPVALYPFVLGQAGARQPGVDRGTFSVLLRARRSRAARTGVGARTLVLGYVYFGLCLGCACIGDAEERVSFPVLALLLTWALWPARPRRFALPVWAAVVGLATGVGFVGQRGLRFLYAEVQNFNPSWLQRGTGGRADAREARTSIGRVGRLKLSGRIVLRVVPRPGFAPPALLREASYNSFKSPNWIAAGAPREFEVVPPGPEEGSWVLGRGRRDDAVAGVTGYLAGGQGLLALPLGVFRLDQLPATSLGTNLLGAVRVVAGPTFYALECRFGRHATLDAPPMAEDMEIPGAERAAVGQVARELGLAGQAPQDMIRSLNAFFSEQFQYRLDQAPPVGGHAEGSPVSRFLTQDRAGHCEHFATATVLLLRQAGIPARYAVGYTVQEKAGDGYVVRERHAHAWCMAHLNGTWQDVDTTPAAWLANDAARASKYEFLSDAWSRLWLEFNKLRFGQSGLRRYLGWLVALLFVLVLAQLVLGRRWRVARRERRERARRQAWPGLDSEFYRLERLLAQWGYPRPPEENLARWLERLQTVPAVAALQVPLECLLALHHRHRFDPVGLNADERERLRTEASACVDQLQRLADRSGGLGLEASPAVSGGSSATR